MSRIVLQVGEATAAPSVNSELVFGFKQEVTEVTLIASREVVFEF